MSPSISANRARVSGKFTELIFDKSENGWYLSSLKDRSSGRSLLTGSADGSLFVLRAKRGSELLESSGARLGCDLVRRGRSSMEIGWTELELADSRCNVSIRVSAHASGLVSAGLSLRCNPPLALWEVDFPVLEGLVPEGATLHTPYGYGKSIPYVDGITYRGTYPSHQCTMQFMAWNAGPSSVYLGCHDPASSTKTLEFLDHPPRFRVTLPIAGAGQAISRYKVPHPTLMGVTPGDWYDAAQIYRKWALRQRWCRAGPLRSRHMPSRFKQVALWCLASGAPEEVVDKALEFRSYFGVPLALHWYVWHQIPFDDHYPEYFPAKPGFKEAVDKLDKAGVLVMPYINARLWDPATESWRLEGAQAAAAKTSELANYVEVYASKVPLSPMCPATSLWRNKIKSIVTRLARECGVHGIYLDQIGAAAPKPCFDSAHGHELGGGNWWVEGYRTMLREVRQDVAAINPDFFITTESNAEPWNDLLDGLLMCNSTEGQLAPIYPAVYADIIPTFGAYIFRSDLENTWSFRVKISQMFLWGTQLGWLGFDVLEPGFRSEAEYLKALAQVRSSTDYLSGGEMLRPPPRDPSVATVDAEWELWGRKWPVHLPVAQATTWRGADGSIGVLACNMGDRATELAVPLNIRELGWTKDKATRIAHGSGFGSANPSVRRGSLRLQMVLEPRSAVCVSSRKGTRGGVAGRGLRGGRSP